MSKQVDDMVALLRSRGHNIWTGGPANPEAVGKIEKFIEGKLPPSYLSFLFAHGSLSIGDSVVSGVIDGAIVDTETGTAVGDTERMREDSDLPVGFLVIDPHEDGAYCLDLKRQRSDGECPVVNFEPGPVQHEIPVATTFDDWVAAFILSPLLKQDA